VFIPVQHSIQQQSKVVSPVSVCLDGNEVETSGEETTATMESRT
jgi:hypothetical protein